MTGTAKTSPSESSGGFTDFMQASYKAGIGAAEDLQAAAMSVPLAILEGIGVPEDKTKVLKEKNRQLVHGLVDSIESMAGMLVEAGTKQVELAATAIREATADKKK